MMSPSLSGCGWSPEVVRVPDGFGEEVQGDAVHAPRHLGVINRRINPSRNSFNQAINHPTIQSFNQLINHSINQSINRSVDQQKNQNQSTNQSDIRCCKSTHQSIRIDRTETQQSIDHSRQSIVSKGEVSITTDKSKRADKQKQDPRPTTSQPIHGPIVDVPYR